MAVDFKQTHKLQAGDAVALIAPASGQQCGQEHLINEGITQLERWGLRVIQTPTIAPLRYLSADDKTRAGDLQAALTHPDVKAIFVTRGGYGCARLLPLLNDIAVPSPRFLVGFSDVTTLHLHFADNDNVISLHAPNVAINQFLAPSDVANNNREALKCAVFSGECPALDGIASPLFNAQKTGGCLTLLGASLGTPYEINTDGKLVMIEEVGETPYKIDRLLTQLKLAGKFDNAAGIVLGEFVGCDSQTIAVDEVCQEVLADVACPVYRAPSFGHGAINLPWRYG